jgi:hypothetical protein
MAQKTFKSNRRMRCLRGSATLNEVKAGKVILGPEPGRTITVHDGWLRAIGGAAATATSVDISDTADTPVVVFKMAVGGLTQNNVARIGLATHYSATTIGSPLTPGKGLRIDDAGGVLAGPTSIDYCIFYTVES